MADGLNMNALSLQESQHAPNGFDRKSYVPPHMRGQSGPPMNAGPPPGGPMPMGNGGPVPYAQPPYDFLSASHATAWYHAKTIVL